MIKHNNNDLQNIIERKNITFNKFDKRKFNKYSYFQTMNAYKELFITKVETIDNLKFNIENDKNIIYYRNYFKIKKSIKNNELFKEICNNIFFKYGIKNDFISTDEDIKKINDIKYKHHVYSEKANYSDFIRMYKFEHDLRSFLLKYTLIIEEYIKNSFISVLNNDKTISANFLTNISSYNTKEFKNKQILRTLKLIIGMYDNTNSKPIRRKREQQLTIPY